ncbi:MAG: Ig-like domain-containing protein [Myxococcaceae bacterium]
MRSLALVLPLLLLGCRDDRTSGSSSGLVLEPAQVLFPRTFVGTPTTAQVQLRNTGNPPRVVSLSTEAPFAVEPGPFELAGGASLSVQLTFSPAAPGEYAGALRAGSDDVVLEAALFGVAEPPLTCTPHNACHRAWFDPHAAVCLEEKLPDDSPCTTPNVCLHDSRCVAGECVGQANRCDDGDACSTDACDPATGCVHFAATARCGSWPNPCQTPICDPRLGCTFVPAADGTSCGAADCDTAEICMLGQCKRVTVVDGAACGSPSPCQARGRCQNHACVRPPAVELTPSWTVWAAPGRHVLWDSIADALGNVYWREYGNDGTYSLVSVTASGFPRYSVPIFPVSQMALMEDLLVLRVGAKLEARTAASGAKAWSRELLVPDGGTGPDAVGSVDVRTLARGPAGTFYIGFLERSPGEPATTLASDIALLKLATGEVLWQVRFPHRQIDDQSTPVDEAGYVYAGMSDLDGNGRRYVALNPQGQLRWDVVNPHSNPAAVFGGRVYHWDHWLSETATGGWVNAEPPTMMVAGYPRLALGTISYVGTETIDVPSCTTPGTLVPGTVLRLARVDPPTSALRWTREIAGPTSGGLSMTNTVLTSNASILFSQAEDYCGFSKRHVLREVTALGQPGFSCRLPGESYFGEGLINGSTWIAGVSDTDAGLSGVQAFELPGFELPEHGWAIAWGSPARDGHSR